MIEKVNPSHPDKIADRIAGALVDYAYTKQDNPKVAFEVLIGHGLATIIAETSLKIELEVVEKIVKRLAGDVTVFYKEVSQDQELSKNQSKLRCGDNGIFKGVPVGKEVATLSNIARSLYEQFPTDGKYILDKDKLIICQSHAEVGDIQYLIDTLGEYKTIINPLGYWTGGTNVDTGAVNRKLGSDMGEAVTGGGLHGKDLSKADVSLNIYAHLKAQETGQVVQLSCAIGDEMIDGIEYDKIVNIAREYINRLGGFEKLAEWGIV